MRPDNPVTEHHQELDLLQVFRRERPDVNRDIGSDPNLPQRPAQAGVDGVGIVRTVSDQNEGSRALSSREEPRSPKGASGTVSSR